MSAPRFYAPVAIGPGSVMPLPEAAAHHAVRVLRLSRGDALVLFNGEGGEYQAEIAEMNKQQVQVKILQFDAIDRQSPLQTTLVQAITSGERMDYAIQKAVELGVHRIIPVTTERSSIRLKGERAIKRVEHWQKVVISACEQCGRNRVPSVQPIVSFADVIAKSDDVENWILHPENSQHPGQLQPPLKPVNIIVGPEGGFSDSELALAQRHHCIAVSMGPRILRMETAGPALLAVMQSLWGDARDKPAG